MRLIVGVIAVALLLAGCGGTSATVPATHARLTANQGGLDVWRDSQGRLTFHWVADNAGEGFRYDPARHLFAQLAGGSVLFSTTYPAPGMGWRVIESLYGVREAKVEAALASGKQAREPADYAVAAPPQKKNAGGYDRFTDYGTDLAGMARDTGFVLPNLQMLEGQPLMAAAFGRPHGPAEIMYGPNPLGDRPVFDIQITKHRPGSSSDSDLVSVYRDREWITVTPARTLSQSKRAEILRALITAPTVG